MIRPRLQGSAFVLDVVDACLSLPEHLHLWWVGQSGFLMAYRGHTAAIDLYLSDSLTTKYANTDTPHVRISERVIAPEQLAYTNLDLVLATHQHTDHLDPDTLTPLMRACLNAYLVVPEAHRTLAATRARTHGRLNGMRGDFPHRVAGFTINSVPAAHDTLKTDERGNLLYYGYVVGAGPFRIYHSGDTVVYDGMAEGLRPFNVDIAILPINGKVGNMNGLDAARLAKEIGAKVVIPCHYDLFEFNTADPYEQFVPECERIAQPYRVLKLGERFTYP